MSIYEYERVKLPQVKVPVILKSRLFNYLKIFNRDYADFVRDLCDINIKWHTMDRDLNFTDQTRFASATIKKNYCQPRQEKQYMLFPSHVCRQNAYVKIELDNAQFPTKQISRLPHVYVSQWQAENLYSFLSKFNRSYADFIRSVCENLFIDSIEAQAGLPEFSDTNYEIFLRIFDELIGVEKYRAKKVKHEWPTGYWQQRRAVILRNRRYA